ncbi:beta-glucosidase [Flavobacterium sp. NST-5]|uniref:Beta-glucosidase n=1 Tax=Flavobacterium ichthyis TaxID=2698827 RepID=A0ABW9Z7T0_9FLAO|nr:glucoamylase family protein [Flavobacterium ichthyis]NBL64241.1 beta-glucosidase [Flavobacterium ichthyis]
MKYFAFILFLFTSCGSSESSSSGDDSTTPVTPPVTISDEQLMDIVQKQTFKYFWDFAEPNSKLARERYHPDGNYPSNDAHIVTTGGSGFGLMSIVAAVSRNYVSRSEAVSRLNTIANFLENADRFHGAWPHWIDGNTGHVKPFGTKDNGGDLVETAFLCQGMICVREFFKNGSPEEQALAQKFDNLWKGVDWNWYRNNQNVLYWHWSPNYNWEMNFPLEGYNECLITYVMAAASPTHPIPTAAYHEGWARNGGITSANTKYGIPLILKHNGAEQSGGPLFWAHYSYLGLDPQQLTDQYANYWDVNVNHSKINYQHCVENPNNFGGYGTDYWGLTASYSRNSDGSVGYDAHMPQNDKGVISPTAAISSIPYTPTESLAAMRNFYVNNSVTMWGPAGFYDAHSKHFGWVAKQYLAIDQGPMVVMIENHRSGLLWNLFMNAPEIRQGLVSLGFHSGKHGF